MNYFKNNENIIVKTLEEIHKKYKLEIALVAIGEAPGHSDQVAHRIIKNKINIPIYLFNSCNIFDIMCLIGSSSVFLGTSLHGNITAISFSVPCMGLDRRISKLNNFLETWNILDGMGSVNYAEILDNFDRVYNYKRDLLNRKSEELINLSYINLKKICSIIK